MLHAPQIVTKTYDLLLYLIPQISKFPRHHRYLLGERLETLGFEFFELLLEACYVKEKFVLLQKGNIKLEQFRYYIRLCKDLRLVTLNVYEVTSKTVNEIGVQLGAWTKQQRSKV